MKKTICIMALGLLSLTMNCYAQTEISPTTSTKTRTEVMAELDKARASGELNNNLNEFYTPKFKSTKTRAEVIAELDKARANGELNNNLNEFYTPVFKSTKTRAEVIAELKEYKKNHPYLDDNYN